jgi:hypothetical protein
MAADRVQVEEVGLADLLIRRFEIRDLHLNLSIRTKSVQQKTYFAVVHLLYTALLSARLPA